MSRATGGQTAGEFVEFVLAQVKIPGVANALIVVVVAEYNSPKGEVDKTLPFSWICDKMVVSYGKKE
ncbi:hypothetical protein IKF03_01300 [Candidatus Saccharibacteria bacterium]|nr:hypothetical protein [Candidatus Saccharibacteria bacterium]